ncbi:carboxynorspermidine decarboxylase, partial [Gammaproteobacteria bacterium]|nr:carboxynorspermidine decarboxylase [Gammaproteobacteria bacterium]
MTAFQDFDPARVPSPCYVVDRAAIESNLRILHRVRVEGGVRLLLALKAFSMFSMAPLVMKYLDGTCASGLHEARLGREEYGGETHVFGAAYSRDDLNELVEIADHLVFNSFGQWQRGQEVVQAAQARRHLEIGLRINPQHSEGATPIYDPSAPRSRLGIPRSAFEGQSLDGISGLHLHNLCEQDFLPLERTFKAVERRFGEFLPQMRWLNLGGGHHITREDYQVDALIAFVREVRQRYGLEVILEPGEAIALNAGVFVTEVLDITENDGKLAILDSSATAHMPDTLEMPYR